MIIDKCGYIARNFGQHRNWWLVKHKDRSLKGEVVLRNIMVPSRYVGKKIRFKIEAVK